MIQVLENIALAPYTYYKIGGPARFFAQPQNVSELREVSEFLRRQKVRYYVLGAGSNVLFDDAGFDGLILHTAKLETSLRRQGDWVVAGAGVPNIQVLRLCMSEGLGGLEFLSGVPGNVGGAVFMNAGTRQGEIKDVVVSVSAYDLFTGAERQIGKEGLRFQYRGQRFLDLHELITGATLLGRPEEPKDVQDRIQQLLDHRRKTQPIDKPSCGSVFKNPKPSHGVFAGRLVEDAGLKGKQIGNAQISLVHSNFIVNLGGAKASDVIALINEVKAKVRSRSGVELEEEVRIVPVDGGAKLPVGES